MRSYKLDPNIYFLRIDKGEEILDTLHQCCKQYDIKCGYFQGIGATDNLEIGILNKRTKKYQNKILKQPLEITSLLGNISTKDKQIYLHAHINASDEKCRVFGGHLMKSTISFTCEIFITKCNPKLIRCFNKNLGLNLIA